MNFYEYLEATNFTEKLGEGIKVAIIDSGCNSHLPNIKGHYNGFTEKLASMEDVKDGAGHGTALAHIIYEIVPQADLYICKAINDKNEASMLSVYNSLLYAIGREVDVVCMSFAGIHELSTTTVRLVNRLIDSGAILCASIGNDNKPLLVYPASMEGVYAVAGLSKDDLSKKSELSNYPLNEIDFTALGEDVQTKWDAVMRTGTSFSNAIVVGQIAYLLSQHGLKAKDVNYDWFKQFFKQEHYQTDTGFGSLYAKVVYNEYD